MKSLKPHEWFILIVSIAVIVGIPVLILAVAYNSYVAKPPALETRPLPSVAAPRGFSP